MEPSTATAGAGVVIEDVTSKFNLESGMKLQGPGITVKDSTSSYNKKYGITMIGSSIFLPTLVQYEGSVSSHHNEKHGILVAFKATVVNVRGALNTYLCIVSCKYVLPPAPTLAPTNNQANELV